MIPVFLITLNWIESKHNSRWRKRESRRGLTGNTKDRAQVGMVATSFLVFTPNLQHTIALMKTAAEYPPNAFVDLLINLRLHCAG